MAKSRQVFSAFYHRDPDLFARKITYTSEIGSWTATPCVYCGDPMTCEDHIYPISALAKLPEQARQIIPKALLRIVPSCDECNGLAGDKVFHAFEDKRQFIKGHLLQKHHGLCDFPTWAPEEIAELQGNLRRYISGSVSYRELLLERFRY